MSVEQQHAVALVLSGFDEAVLLVLVLGIEVDQIAALVGLVVFDERLILLEGEVFTLDILEQGEVFGAVVEVGLREHTVVDEQLQVIPLLLIVLAVVLEGLLQAVGHLLRDVGGDFLHVGITLQIRPAHVKRNVG